MKKRLANVPPATKKESEVRTYGLFNDIIAFLFEASSKHLIRTGGSLGKKGKNVCYAISFQDLNKWISSIHEMNKPFKFTYLQACLPLSKNLKKNIKKSFFCTYGICS